MSRILAPKPIAPTRTLAVACFAALSALVSTPSAATAQDGCEFGDQGNDVVNRQTLPTIGVVTYITRPHFVCADGVQIWADSAVAYDTEAMSHLMGAVRYLEAGRELLADEARYFSSLGRLQAQGHMSIRDDAQGSSIENGELVYLRRTAFRDEETMTVVVGPDGIRPKAVLTPPSPDSVQAGLEPAEPYTVVGDRMFLTGSSNFTAAGTVEIVRDALLAFADSAEFDQAGGDLVLVGSARVDGESYDLAGRTITMASPDEGTSEVHALRDARLTGDDLVLRSARIVVFLRDDQLERLVATSMDFGGEEPDSTEADRPEARVENFVLTADSLEVAAPAQRVERVFAAGTARSVSTSRDSLNVDLLPEIARTDWLEGDTVIVTFRPTEPGGAEGGLKVETITALVEARSLYRLDPADSTAQAMDRAGGRPPAVHYVMGDRIVIEMDDGEVLGMQVEGRTRGMHLEPLPPRRATADSSLISIDSTAILDTIGVIDTLHYTPPAPVAGVADHPHEQPTRARWFRAPDAPREETTWTHL